MDGTNTNVAANTTATATANGGTNGANGNDGANVDMQREIDKAITKALATQKAKLDKEYNEKLNSVQSQLDAFQNAGLTDAEKAAKQLAAAKKAESEYIEKSKRLDVEGAFTAMGISKDDSAPLIDDLFKGDYNSASSKIGALIEKQAAVKAKALYEAQLANIPQAQSGNDGKKWTKESFQKLTYSQQMAELSKNPSLINLIK